MVCHWNNGYSLSNWRRCISLVETGWSGRTVDQPLTDVDVVSLVTDNETKVDSENRVISMNVLYNSIQNKLMIFSTKFFLRNLIFSMDPDTEKALKIQRGLPVLFSRVAQATKKTPRHKV